MPHTATYKYHKVKVRLKSGEWFVDRFLDRKSTVIIFQNRRVRRGDIVAFIPYHGENHGQHKRI